MAYDGWVTLANTEIINSPRAIAYAQRAGIDVRCTGGCPDLSYVLEDSDYETTFDPPWVDDSIAASSQFLGFIGMEVTGISDGTATHLVTDIPGDGAVLGVTRHNRREIGVRVLAVAETEAALNYGLAWLNSVLRGSLCQRDCTGDQLCFYDVCPGSEGTPDEEHEEHLRTIQNVGVLQPPTVLQRVALASGACLSGVTGPAYVAELEYILVAGIPFIYQTPMLVADPTIFTTESNEPVVCPPAIDCSQDPTCSLGFVPALPVPVNPCAVPLAGDYDTAWTAVPASVLSDWFEKVPYVVVAAGTTALRSVTVRIYPDPGGIIYAIDGEGPTCAACVELNIPYIPASASVTVDGRTERTSIACPTAALGSVGSPQIFGRNSGPYTWPILECGTGYAVQVQIHAANHGPGSSVEVYLVDRQDSS